MVALKRAMSERKVNRSTIATLELIVLAKREPRMLQTISFWVPFDSPSARKNVDLLFQDRKRRERAIPMARVEKKATIRSNGSFGGGFRPKRAGRRLNRTADNARLVARRTKFGRQKRRPVTPHWVMLWAIRSRLRRECCPVRNARQRRGKSMEVRRKDPTKMVKRLR
jgi:hypothetical protein